VASQVATLTAALPQTDLCHRYKRSAKKL